MFNSLDNLEAAKLLKWPGGRHLDQAYIFSLMPAHDTYVEPFCGGATIFFKKPLVKINVIGDTDERLMRFYSAVRQGAARKCPQQVKCDRETFWKAKRASERDGSNVCSMLVTNRLGYHGIDKTYTGDKACQFGTNRKLYTPDQLSEVESKLRRAFLTSQSFETTMEAFDSPTTWHFLDPPWWLAYSEEKYKSGLSVTPEKVYQVASKMKGKVLIIYNDHPKVRQALCRNKFRCFTYDIGVNTGGVRRNRPRLIAVNY